MLLCTDNPFGYNFSSACDSHDRCYGTPGANRSDCDLQLKTALKETGAPGLLVNTSYGTVRLFGSVFFWRAQNGAVRNLSDDEPGGTGGDPEPGHCDVNLSCEPIPTRGECGVNMSCEPQPVDCTGICTPLERSRDPNHKSGPGGSGDEHFVREDAAFSYRIDFENDSTATAPANRVVVTDDLEPDLVTSAFELTEIGFGDRIIPVPSGSSISRPRSK